MSLQIFSYFLFLSLSISPSNHQTSEGDLLEIEITRQTTMEELQQIQQFLKKEGIDMQIRESTFNDYNQLISIRIEVSFGNGKSQTYGAKNFKKFSIVRDYRKDAEQPFCIGNCI